MDRQKKKSEKASNLRALLTAKKSELVSEKSGADQKVSVITPSNKVGKQHIPVRQSSPSDWRQSNSPSRLWADLTMDMLSPK